MVMRILASSGFLSYLPAGTNTQNSNIARAYFHSAITFSSLQLIKYLKWEEFGHRGNLNILSQRSPVLLIPILSDSSSIPLILKTKIILWHWRLHLSFPPAVSNLDLWTRIKGILIVANVWNYQNTNGIVDFRVSGYDLNVFLYHWWLKCPVASWLTRTKIKSQNIMAFWKAKITLNER